MSHLVIVESPAKARTLEKYLGKNFHVKASVGHVKDLPKSKLGVDVKKKFKPEYVVLKDKQKVLDEIKKAAKKSDAVYLAPDPDREGEAIAWHIRDELKKINTNIQRVSFNQITKNAVLEAFKHPYELDENRFNAQQTRRILDRLVGYMISPVLWDKVRRGLSAGRVQSVAVRLIVEREREIQAFKPEEYWTVSCFFEKNNTLFEAKLFKINDEKPEIKNEQQSGLITQDLNNGKFQVTSIERKEKKRNPLPPYITSTLQQDAYSRYRFTTKKTMGLAQKLYEGVDLGDLGTHGLITYMRTDSTNIAPEAVHQARSFITQTYGKDFIPQAAHMYKSAKAAQEAHECVRPTSVDFEPSKVKRYLAPDQFKLYQLIWNRFLACQMSAAVFDQTAIDISCSQYVLRANGSILKFEGFLKVYGEREESNTLPELVEKELLSLNKVDPKQHFTQPPPRFNEGSLVKDLESKGIGRPSTYASILSNIVEKKYVEKNEGRFQPTELGLLVTDLLVKSFPEILDIAFTADMENQLDAIEEGKADWIKLLDEFYKSFSQHVKKAKKEMKDVKGQETPTDLKCTTCHASMVIKWGRRGKFLACSNYPECRETSDFKEVDGIIEIVKPEVSDEKCEKCGSPMQVKSGRFGKFLACSKYPECKSTKSLGIGIKCPLEDCGGDVVQRRSKRGRFFYGCSKYPKCNFVSWYKPISQACPKCKASYVLEKVSKKEGTMMICSRKECDYKKSL
ncbi:MAG: type I DNA topoisomerase [Deltaproteobacteria bacterium]|nr:type I DNA topoisomerase [Deltaproteobacteria bacterium]